MLLHSLHPQNEHILCSFFSVHVALTKRSCCCISFILKMGSFFLLSFQSTSLCGNDYAVAMAVISGKTGSVDIVLGDAFLRNVYTEFNRDAVNHRRFGL